MSKTLFGILEEKSSSVELTKEIISYSKKLNDDDFFSFIVSLYYLPLYLQNKNSVNSEFYKKIEKTHKKFDKNYQSYLNTIFLLFKNNNLLNFIFSSDRLDINKKEYILNIIKKYDIDFFNIEINKNIEKKDNCLNASINYCLGFLNENESLKHLKIIFSLAKILNINIEKIQFNQKKNLTQIVTFYNKPIILDYLIKNYNFDINSFKILSHYNKYPASDLLLLSLICEYKSKVLTYLIENIDFNKYINNIIKEVRDNKQNSFIINDLKNDIHGVSLNIKNENKIEIFDSLIKNILKSSRHLNVNGIDLFFTLIKNNSIKKEREFFLNYFINLLDILENNDVTNENIFLLEDLKNHKHIKDCMFLINKNLNIKNEKAKIVLESILLTNTVNMNISDIKNKFKI